ncbi:hypothetical protein E8E12_000365 [Didymella heteroderae]|uniref:Uncharacterized protein n=1 Tax=Didymella heteroderae TaxID=1769908 RepID=A0A9P4WVW4_9PLEO|nr:hypothetical protein E8E12_000365 [Didymella heteroderae]
MAKNLKDMVVSQVEACYGPSRSYFGKFDVLQLKIGDTFVAYAVGFSKSNNIGLHDHKTWAYLLGGLTG